MSEARGTEREWSDNGVLVRLPGRDVGVVLASCAVVVTGAVLGVEFLSADLLGLPVGLWCVAGTYIAAKVMGRRSRALGGEEPAAVATPTMHVPRTETLQLDLAFGAAPEPVAGDEPPRPVQAQVEAPIAPTRPVSGLSTLVAKAARAASRRSPALAQRSAGLSQRLSEWHDTSDAPAAPIRLGLCVPTSVASRLRSAPGQSDVEWMTLPLPEDPAGMCRDQHLDAIIVGESPTSLVVWTNESPDRESSWYDWARPRPLSYASVFPLRVDPSRVTCPITEEELPRVSGLLSALVEAAAVGSRFPTRLSIADRLAGRRPISPVVSLRELDQKSPRLHRAMGRLCESLLLSFDEPHADELKRTAARICSAWVAMDPTMEPGYKVRVAQAARRVLKGEVEPMLRLAALRVMQYDDENALAELIEADRLLRVGGHPLVADPLPFVLGDLETGGHDPATLGRAAAGLCLVVAITPPERLEYLRDDLAEDLRFSSSLLGRDDDQRLLIDVVRRLHDDRKAQAPAPQAAAAA